MRLITLFTLTAAAAMAVAGCTEKSSSTPAPAPAPASAPAPSATTPARASTPAPAAEPASGPAAAQPAPTANPAPAPAAPAAVITPARIEMGRKAYTIGACSMCHGPDAKGSAGGPNLAAGVWAHGDGSVASILAVIEKGVPKSQIKNASYPLAMPPAAMYLPDADDRLALAEYIWSLSHPAQN